MLSLEDGQGAGAMKRFSFYILAVPWSLAWGLLTVALLAAGILVWPFPFDPEISAFRPAYSPFVPIEYAIHYALVAAAAGLAVSPWAARYFLRRKGVACSRP